VGAVVVWRGQIIGEGWHQAFGGPHAEVHAIQNVADKSLLRESTLYVSLEPCNHHGKTPPCTQLILAHGLPRVVVGSIDPNPAMGGKSIALLRAAGLEVLLAADQQPALDLNKHFLTNQGLRRPFLTLKWAESQDGYIAAFDAHGKIVRTAISGVEAAHHVHRLRHEHQAILVGAGTALVDAPALTCRHWPGRNPVRIILDQDLRVPANAAVFRGDGLVIVVNASREGADGNIRYIRHSGTLENLMSQLYLHHHLGSILVEGGADVLMQFIRAQLMDEAHRIIAPKALHHGLAAPQVQPDWQVMPALQLGADSLLLYQRA
jgi:diaminohydroxyphosphoribosylaminopyrimidine deaminase/5-amino-6-(5-phosphoribosylamino)uracil reductase